MKSMIVYSLLVLTGLAFSMGQGETEKQAAAKDFAILLKNGNGEIRKLLCDVSLKKRRASNRNNVFKRLQDHQPIFRGLRDHEFD
jgi:hypothetical protein